VKKLYWFLENGDLDHDIHTWEEYEMKLPDSLDGYTVIIVIRNPYERLVSGFVDKYKSDGQYVESWIGPTSPVKDVALTFENFVSEIITHGFRVVNAHHFVPQMFTRSDRLSEVCRHKQLFVYDLKNIDYAKLEELFGTKIPESILNFRGGHEREKHPELTTSVHNLKQEEYHMRSPLYSCFYNDAIIQQVQQYFKEDFDFFDAVGFRYAAPRSAEDAYWVAMAADRKSRKSDEKASRRAQAYAFGGNRPQRQALSGRQNSGTAKLSVLSVLPSLLSSVQPPSTVVATVLPSAFTGAAAMVVVTSAAIVVTLPSAPTVVMPIMPLAPVSVIVLPPLLTTAPISMRRMPPRSSRYCSVQQQWLPDSGHTVSSPS
jgi:hypothetical protein